MLQKTELGRRRKIILENTNKKLLSKLSYNQSKTTTEVIYSVRHKVLSIVNEGSID